MKNWQDDWRWFLDHAKNYGSFITKQRPDPSGVLQRGIDLSVAEFGERMYKRGYEDRRQEETAYAPGTSAGVR